MGWNTPAKSRAVLAVASAKRRHYRARFSTRVAGSPMSGVATDRSPATQGGK